MGSRNKERLKGTVYLEEIGPGTRPEHAAYLEEAGMRPERLRQPEGGAVSGGTPVREEGIMESAREKDEGDVNRQECIDEVHCCGLAGLKTTDGGGGEAVASSGW